MRIRSLRVIARTRLGQVTVGYDFSQLVLGLAVNRMAGHLNFQLMLGPVYSIVSFKTAPYDSRRTSGRSAR